MKDKERKIRKIVTTIISLLISGYLLNFFWESLHGAFLYACCNFEPQKYVSVMSYASAMDALLILGIYVIISILWKDFLWIEKTNKKHIYTFVALGLLIALIIEYKALYIFNQWQYNELMPTIFGIGLSPLVQLSITGLFAIWLTKKLIQDGTKKKN